MLDLVAFDVLQYSAETGRERPPIRTQALPARSIPVSTHSNSPRTCPAVLHAAITTNERPLRHAGGQQAGGVAEAVADQPDRSWRTSSRQATARARRGR
jgi:hypothetical protein